MSAECSKHGTYLLWTVEDDGISQPSFCPSCEIDKLRGIRDRALENVKRLTTALEASAEERHSGRQHAGATFKSCSYSACLRAAIALG